MEAGAETYFGKQAKDLTLGEAACWLVCQKRQVNIRQLQIRRKQKNAAILF